MPLWEVGKSAYCRVVMSPTTEMTGECVENDTKAERRHPNAEKSRMTFWKRGEMS